MCIPVSADAYCPEIVNSVEEVASCPTTKQENDRAASKKNCSRISLGKKCNNYQLSYHCIINGYRNQTLEVCAPSKRIVGGNVLHICIYISTGTYSLTEVNLFIK